VLLFLSLLLSFIVSLVVTKALISLPPRFQLVDRPNARSSHKNPTLRGGGLAIVVSVLCGALLLALSGIVSWKLSGLLVLGGLPIAAVGLMDDIRSRSTSLRLTVQLFVSGITACLLRAEIATYFGIAPIAALLLATLFLCWMINLFNFMDGIDGIAGVQALSVALLGAFLCHQRTLPEQTWLFLAIGGAAAGFLIFNWQPARIFMGDVGSGFLGFALGLLILWVPEYSGRHFLDAGLILMAVFVADTAYTLIRRVLRGERVHQAHRTHAYQKATQRGLSHAKVAAFVLRINVLWLGPLAFASGHLINPWLALALAYVPLFLTAKYLKAGTES